jgi:hypothetical protein
MQTAKEWADALVAEVETRRAERERSDQFVASQWGKACDEAMALATKLEPLIKETTDAFSLAFPHLRIGPQDGGPISQTPRADEYPPTKKIHVFCNGESFTIAISRDGVLSGSGDSLPKETAIAGLRNWLRTKVMPPPARHRF